MAVYVDDMRTPYQPHGRRRMLMCHMLADTSAELHAMADRIGVLQEFCEAPGTPDERYDICKSKRALAVRQGAKEITRREAAMMRRRRRMAAGGLRDVG